MGSTDPQAWKTLSGELGSGSCRNLEQARACVEKGATLEASRARARDNRSRKAGLGVSGHPILGRANGEGNSSPLHVSQK